MVAKTARFLPDRRPLLWLSSLLLLGAALQSARPALSQELDAEALEELVAPVALYPDDVLGIILPASTFPLDIVRAARFLEDLESDPTLAPDPEWDDSVVALLNYPEVVRLMDEDIDWTWELGEAVLTDQAAVLAAAQRFRSRALAAGNLQSDARQTVTTTQGTIAIRPADPTVVYIPVYEPREIVVYQPYPIWHYYPVAYPVYYYPYPAGYAFNVGFFWGVTSYFSIGWHSHYVHVHHHTHYGHPYYLNSYYSYAPYYPRSHVNITVVANDYDHVWQPSPRRGSRPETVTVEGRTSAMRTQRTATVESQSGGAPRASASRSSTADARAGAEATRQRMSTDNGNSSSGTFSAPQSGTPQSATSRTRPAPQGSATAAPTERSEGARTTATSEQPSRRMTTTTRPEPTANAPATTRMSPPTSTRSAPQASTQRAPSSSQSSMGGSTRSSASASPRAQGTTSSGGDRASSSTARQSQR